MRTARRHLLTVVALLGALSSASRVSAQTITTGDLLGVVKDASGAVVPNASVTLKNTETGETRSATANESGAYRFTFLKPAKYQIEASVPGLKSDNEMVDVQVGQAQSLDLIVKVEQSTQIIEVNESAGLINIDNANLATTISTKQIQELPMAGGDITTVAFTVPGINLSTGMGYGNFSSHGLPGTSNLFTINGNDYNDPYLNLNNSGASNLLLGQNEIAEASVVQNGYSVQYGRQSGAQVNFITKSGSNALHSTLLYNYNSDAFNANDFFANSNGVQRPRSLSNQWGANIGGPAIRNKLFFFVNNEGLYYTLPSTAVVTIPSPQLQSYILQNIQAPQVPLYENAFKVWNAAPGIARGVPVTTGGAPTQDATGNLGCGQLAGTPTNTGGTFGIDTPCAVAFGSSGSNQNREWLLTARADWDINQKQKINFRYKTDHGFQPTGTNLISPGLNLQSIQPQQEGQVNWTWTPTPTTVNNFIGSVLWYSAIFGPANASASQAVFPTYFGIFDGGSNGGGFTALGVPWYNFPQGRNVGQGQLIDDYSFIHGNHTFKIGANFRKNKVTDYGLETGITGSYFFNSLADFANGVTNPNTGSYYYQKFSPITAAHIRFYNVGFYFQDEWSVSPTVKITAGLRLDRTANPSCLDNCFSRLTAPFPDIQQGINIPYNQSIQTGLSHAYYNTQPVVVDPRFGIVWSPPFAKGMVVRGGVGLFSDLAPGFLVSNVFNNAPYPFNANIFGGQTVSSPSDPNGAPAAALNQYNAFKTGFFNGATLAELNNSVPGGFAPIPYYSVPSTFKTPRVIEWSIEIQQPIGKLDALIVTYSGNSGYNLLVTNAFLNSFANTSNFPNGFGGLPLSAADGRFSTITQLTNGNISNYNGLSVQWRRSLAYGFSGQIGYTYSHSLDDISNGGVGENYSFCSGCSLSTQPAPDIHASYGNSDYDIRNSMVADMIWDTPWKFNNQIENSILGGWTVSGKFYVRSGTPYSIINTQLAGEVSPNLTNVTLLATLTNPAVKTNCGVSAVNTPCYTNADFLASGRETTFGNVGRNTFRGPGYDDVDATLYKNFYIKEKFKFTFGASAFNLLNHAHFQNPSANIAAPGLGQITATAIPPTSAYGAFQGSAVSGRVIVITGRFSF